MKGLFIHRMKNRETSIMKDTFIHETKNDIKRNNQ